MHFDPAASPANNALTLQQKLLDFRQRVVNGEEITEEDIREGIKMIRRARSLDVYKPAKAKAKSRAKSKADLPAVSLGDL